MSDKKKYLTVIVSDPNPDEASELIGHPKISAASWSHVIQDRDSKDTEIAELRSDNARLIRACSMQQNEIQQTLGRALGYPRLCEDQKNFPGSTDSDGVCIGDHVAETLAMEAAERIKRLETDLFVAKCKWTYARNEEIEGSQILGAWKQRAQQTEERVAEQQEAVDQAVALVEYLEGHSKGAMAERVKTALSAKFAQERAAYASSLRELAACAYQAMGVHDAPDSWLDALSNAAAGLPFETESLLPYAPQAVCDAIAERDEARECVGRLWQALRIFKGCAYPVCSTLNPRGHAWSEAYLDNAFIGAEQALAATPEHLR